MTRSNNNAEHTAAQRKQMLIVQGAMYRLGLVESKNELRANLQPAVLAKSALNSLMTTTSAALGQGFTLNNIRGANLQTALPLLVSVISLLVKRRGLIKPVLIGGIALAAANGIMQLALKRKAARQSATVSSNHDVPQTY